MSEETAQIETCDVCIMGAGLAGLNALFVASRYLTPGQRVILVDRRSCVGGMWVDTYSYVRLHQPHPMFTAGNIEWILGRERGYPATKDEVLQHFSHCMDVIRQRVRVDEFLGWTLESTEFVSGHQRITCRNTGGAVVTIDAKRLIKASGVHVTPNDPLSLSSSNVHSVSPDSCDVRAGAIAASTAPVWVIGGGKTGMDTAHALITTQPGRQVNLVAGSGTFFLSRDRTLPIGSRRWWSGAPVSRIGYEAARRFDGTNEETVASWFRSRYGTWLTPKTRNFLFGVLSEQENATIAAGLTDTLMDHLVDVVDGDGGPELVFRSGQRRRIPPGSWVVNCTGYLFKDETPYEPYVSDNGTVLSINTRSAPLHLSSFMAYFLTHLLFLGKITEVPLYAVDAEALDGKSRVALTVALFSLVQYNLGLISDVVPSKVFTDCGLDFDRWYPSPRRLVGTVRFLRTKKRDREHHRHSLDTVAERFGIRCEPLVTDAAAV